MLETHSLAPWRYKGDAVWVVSQDGIRWTHLGFHTYKLLGVKHIFLALLQEGLELFISSMKKTFRACIALGSGGQGPTWAVQPRSK
jgi:hypothetical protein